MENKVIDFSIEDGKLIVNVDPNQDGDVMLSISVDLTEIPDEVLSFFKNK